MKTLLGCLTALLLIPVANGATLTLRPLAHPVAPRVLADAGYSVDLPIVGRVRGATTTFYTALDVTNNTASSTEVDFTYIPSGGTSPRSGILTTLGGYDNLHIDDFIQALVSGGILPGTALDNTYGTLLLTFTNAAFHNGTEATAVARIYSFAGASGGPTYGLAYRALALQTNGAHSLSTIVRSGDGLVTNIGIENVGIDDAGAATGAATVSLSFFDPSTGAATGAQTQLSIAPGQVIQINDVLSQPSFQLPAGKILILFVDEVSGTAQIRGYSVLKDTFTNDGSMVFMQESPARVF